MFENNAAHHIYITSPVFTVQSAALGTLGFVPATCCSISLSVYRRLCISKIMLEAKVLYTLPTHLKPLAGTTRSFGYSILCSPCLPRHVISLSSSIPLYLSLTVSQHSLVQSNSEKGEIQKIGRQRQTCNGQQARQRHGHRSM
jgi:hypothetical protein